MHFCIAEVYGCVVPFLVTSATLPARSIGWLADMHQVYANERQIGATVSGAPKSRMVDIALPQEHRAPLQERWEDLQQRFLKLSSRATYSVGRSSGHFIQRDDPRAVLAVIQAAIVQARCAPSVSAAGGC